MWAAIDVSSKELVAIRASLKRNEASLWDFIPDVLGACEGNVCFLATLKEVAGKFHLNFPSSIRRFNPFLILFKFWCNCLRKHLNLSHPPFSYGGVKLTVSGGMFLRR